MAGAADFFPPFSFCAAIISCLLRSASSRAFCFSLLGFFLTSLLLLSSLLLSKLLLLLNSDLFPLGLFFLQSLQLLLFLGSFLPPLMDVLLELIVQLTLLCFVLVRCHDVALVVIQIST